MKCAAPTKLHRKSGIGAPGLRLVGQIYFAFALRAFFFAGRMRTWLLTPAFFLGRSRSTEEADELGADGRAKAGTGVPAGAGGKCAVVSGGDIVECGGCFRGIDQGLD